jgi:hypothetical protein
MTSGSGQNPRLRHRLMPGALALGGFASMLALSVSYAGAQDGPNPSVTLSFGTSLSINDNKALDPVSAGTTTSLDNSLGLAYQTETATSLLRLDLGTVLRFSNEPGKTTKNGFDNHRASLRYVLTGASSQLAVSASQRQSDVSNFDPFAQAAEDPTAPVDSVDLTPGSVGQRTDRSVRLGFETGTGGPLGFSASLSRRERSFTGTTSSDLYDSLTDSVSLGSSLHLSDRSTATVSLSQTDYSAQDVAKTDRSTRKLALGLDHALTPSLTLGASLGKTWIDLDETSGAIRSRSSRDGINGGLSLTKALPNGSLGLSYSRDISINGARDSLQLTRSMDLPRGKLDLALGTSQLDGRKATWIGSLGYSHELPRGAITARLNRQGSTSDAKEEIVSTRLNLGWSQELTAQTGVSMSFDYLDVASDVAGKDRSRARLNLAYTWDLAQDWQLSGGYSHTRAHEASGNAKSNTVFLSLQRALTFAP